MTGTSVEIIGEEAAAADLKRWADQLAGEVVKNAAVPTSERVADVVRGRVPHLSGQLAGSVATEIDDDGAGIGYDGSVPYDGWIEFGGTRGRDYISQGRYVYPSMLDAQDEYLQAAASASVDTAERFPWSTPAS